MRTTLVALAIAATAVSHTPAFTQPADESANQTGERAFQRCYSCHSVNKGDKGLSGPNLDRLIGRQIAADAEFEYSKAFRKFAKRNTRWTKPLLDRFLKNPSVLVPGNEMGFFGLKDTKERAAIVTYLAADE